MTRCRNHNNAVQNHTRRRAGLTMLLGLWVCMTASPAQAAALSPALEYRIIANVGATDQTVLLENTYTNAVPICTYVTVGTSSPSALPRISSIGPDRFTLRIQEITGGSNTVNNPVAGTVFCLIAEEGLHTLPDGRRFEALTVVSDRTTGQANRNWRFTDMEEITGAVLGTYTNPVAVVGLISANDPQPTAPFVYDCDSRGNPGFFTGASDRICVGKHTGQISTTRLNETIGIIIAEQGSGTANGVFYNFFRGADSIDGIGTNTGTGYSVSADFDAAVVTQQGEDGGQGGWATLVGSDPLPSGFIRISIDEEVVAGDKSRTHITEIVDVFAFRDDRTVQIEGEKTNTVWNPDGDMPFGIPGEDISYTITLRNTGNGAADPGSIFLVDSVPAEVDFFNGDYDPTDADTSAVLFEETSSGLTFTPGTDLGFAGAGAPPTSFAQCNLPVSSGYDPAIRYICLKPGGAFQSGTPSPSASFSFRAKIR